MNTPNVGPSPIRATVVPKSNLSGPKSPYEKGEGQGPQHRPETASVTPRATRSGSGAAYDLGNGVKPQHQLDTRQVTPKATSGDTQRPVMMQVVRAKPIVSASRPKFQARNAKEML